MKIVTNGHDLYAIRKGIWPFYRYFDLKTPNLWWGRTSKFYMDCWTYDEHKIEAWYGILNPKKAVVICIEKNN